MFLLNSPLPFGKDELSRWCTRLRRRPLVKRDTQTTRALLRSTLRPPSMPERSAIATPLEFRGVDATECEAFISAVAAHALAEGKQHDDQWIAEFASSCFTQAGLRWWNGLEEKDQRSWKLLRRAMLFRFQPTFSGGSGEEAETFVRMVHQKAFEAGKYSDDKWIPAFVLTCLVGDAMRWHASLDPATRNDWNLLWPALLAQYTRDGPNGSQLLKPRRRGRIQVRKKTEQGPLCYLSKKLWWNNANQLGRITLTQTAIQALEVEYNPLLTGSQTLHIPDNQIPGCDILGIQWHYEDTTRSDNWMAACGVNSNSGIGTPGRVYCGPLSTNTWEMSPTVDSRALRQLFGANGLVYLVPVSSPTWPDHVWFKSKLQQGLFEVELYFEQV